MERISKSLEINKTLNEAIPTLVEVFVNFYGEECREYITSKFNNIILVGYYDDTQLGRLVRQLQEKATRKYLSEAFAEINIEYNLENIEKYTANNIFDNIQLFPIIGVCKYIKLVKDGEIEILKKEQVRKYQALKKHIVELEFDDFVNGKVSEEQIERLPFSMRSNINYWLYKYDISRIMQNQKERVFDIIKKMYPEATLENIDKLILSGKLDNIFEIGRKITNGCIKYREYSEKNISKYSILKDKLHDLKEKLDYQYFMRYVLELKDYLNKEDQEILTTQNKISESLLKRIKVIFGDGLGLGYYFDMCGSIEYFDDRSEAVLNDPNVFFYRKDAIMENRIKYFKYHGINLGKDYRDYVNDARCQAIWPSQEMITRVQERRDYYLNQANIEYFTNFDVYKETLEAIKKNGLLDKEGILEPKMFLRQQTSVVTNLKRDGDGYKLFPLVSIYANYSEYDDKALIHELNHVFELELLNVSENEHEYEMICGWDKMVSTMNQDDIVPSDTIHLGRKRREYEAFNEIINELLSKKIAKEMHDASIFILNSPDDYNDNDGTLYDFSAFLVMEFFNEYFDDIVASRRNNNIEIIWNKVGKENFDALNGLFYEFNDVFSQRVFEQLEEDIKNKRDTDLVRQYNSLNQRRDEILMKMREYSKNNSVNKK